MDKWLEQQIEQALDDRLNRLDPVFRAYERYQVERMAGTADTRRQAEEDLAWTLREFERALC